MAAPNLVNVTSIIGKTNDVIIANTTGAFSVLSNALGSNQVFKVNTVTLANYGTVTCNVSFNAYGNAALAGTVTPRANNISIPVGAVLTLVDKSATFYLEEDRSLGALSTVGNTVSVMISYEVLS